MLFEGVLCTAIVKAFDQMFRPEYLTAGSGWTNTYLTVTTMKALGSIFVFYDVLQRTCAKAVAGRSPGADRSDPERATPAGGGRTTEGRARFWGLLPRSVSRDVICIGVDDHYLDVHTTGGSCRILMSMAQTVADLGDLGMQVHRSWWVARRHMTATYGATDARCCAVPAAATCR